jgi:hypothetical protein
MTLDHACSSVNTATFNHIGVQRSLHQELCISDSTSVFFKNPHKGFTNCFALCFRLGNSLEFFKESRTSINMNEFNTHVALKRFDHLCAFVLAHQPDVYIDAGELATNRLMH